MHELRNVHNISRLETCFLLGLTYRGNLPLLKQVENSSKEVWLYRQEKLNEVDRYMKEKGLGKTDACKRAGVSTSTESYWRRRIEEMEKQMPQEKKVILKTYHFKSEPLKLERKEPEPSPIEPHRETEEEGNFVIIMGKGNALSKAMESLEKFLK